MFTQPSRFSWHDEHAEYEMYEGSVPERFNNGDLAIFQPFAVAYASADIRVECHVQYIPADTPSLRALAARFDQLGFLAQQRPDKDVLDIYELSPYLLGPAVADSVALTKPGRRPGIIIPEHVRGSNNVGASADLTIQHTTESAPNAIKVPHSEVTAFGTVQTHWRPKRRWGIDPHKKFGVWVRIKDDGEYLYKPTSVKPHPSLDPFWLNESTG
jgi:hypothetical protein